MNRFLAICTLGFFAISCSNYGQLTFITKLPKKLRENSGIIYLKDSTVWAIEDRGNTDEIYQIDFGGNLLRELKVKNGKNKDWEDLAKDEKDNVYIADTGDNSRKRNDCIIYKLPNPETEPGDKIDAQKISFSYPDKKKYDAEALFYNDNFLYIVTKNRTNPFDGIARIFKVPSKKGNYTAELVGEFVTCKEPHICQVTAADISPDEKKVVLLGYGKLWVFTDFSKDDFTKGKIETIDLGATTQLESVCFMDENTLLLSDEERANTGRNLYSFKLVD